MDAFQNLKNKRVTVVGLGRSGLSAALLLAKTGNRVRVTEKNDNADIRKHVRLLAGHGVGAETGGHSRDFIESSEFVVTSPGVADCAPPLEWARQLRIPVIDEIELAYRLTPGPIAAITGTNGKSTVTRLIGEILKAAGKKVSVCGNIGVPATGEVLSLTAEHIVVEEVSSFQLSRTEEFRPHVSVILNLTRNHLDRHGSFCEYEKAKRRIFSRQTAGDWCVLNYDDDNLRKLKDETKTRVLFFSAREKVEGIFTRDGVIVESIGGKQKEIGKVKDIRLNRPHNLENAMAACLVATVFRVSPETMMGVLAGFEGLEHRQEYVDTIGGVKFINDSKSTTVAAAIAALRAVSGPVALICGGRDKGAAFTGIRGEAEGKVGALILLGEAKEKIYRALKGIVPEKAVVFADSLPHAVEAAAKAAGPGWTVLLSPMCASFDMFRDFEERGRVFKEAVKALGNS